MPTDINKLLNAMNRTRSKESIKRAEATDIVENVVPDFELDDDGEEYMPVGTEGVLAATEKLLAINRGLVYPDERDSLKFQKILRPHAMLRESIKMDAGKIARQIMYNASKTKNLKGVQPGAFDGYVKRLMTGNPLTTPLEEINPMQLVANARRITKMGPGGLGSDQSITQEAQDIHPSQFGFISVIEGPECHALGTNIFTERGWDKIENITFSTKLACYNEGKLEFNKPERIIKEPYTGVMIGVACNNVKFLVTPNHRIFYTEKEEDTVLKVDTAEKLFSKNIFVPSALNIYTGMTVKKIEIKSEQWFKQEYNGTVYCATVPGGMLYTSYGSESGLWTGNSARAGIDVRTAMGTKIGSNGRLYQKFYDKRKKKYSWMSPLDLDGLVVKIPD